MCGGTGGSGSCATIPNGSFSWRVIGWAKCGNQWCHLFATLNIWHKYAYRSTGEWHWCAQCIIAKSTFGLLSRISAIFQIKWFSEELVPNAALELSARGFRRIGSYQFIVCSAQLTPVRAIAMAPFRLIFSISSDCHRALSCDSYRTVMSVRVQEPIRITPKKKNEKVSSVYDAQVCGFVILNLKCLDCEGCQRLVRPYCYSNKNERRSRKVHCCLYCCVNESTFVWFFFSFNVYEQIFRGMHFSIIVERVCTQPKMCEKMLCIYE